MSLQNDLRHQSKLDSRRFGKSVVCRIVHGPLLAFVEQQGLSPTGIFFNNKTGLNPSNNRMFVIPVAKYPEIERLFTDRNTQVTEAVSQEDVELYEKITRSQEALIKALKQNLILITIDFGSVPENKKSGPLPEGYDVLIDSTDVNQNIKGEYIYRNIKNLRQNFSWYDPTEQS